jgi:hypothetical protein
MRISARALPLAFLFFRRRRPQASVAHLHLTAHRGVQPAGVGEGAGLVEGSAVLPVSRQVTIVPFCSVMRGGSKRICAMVTSAEWQQRHPQATNTVPEFKPRPAASSPPETTITSFIPKSPECPRDCRLARDAQQRRTALDKCTVFD